MLLERFYLLYGETKITEASTRELKFQRFALGRVKSGTKFVVVATLVYSFIKEHRTPINGAFLYVPTS